MHFTSVLSILLVKFTFSEAFVEFEFSRLYDEKDFEGASIVYNSNYCSPGCNIYVSIPDASKGVAQNILIEAYQGAQVSLLEVDTKLLNAQKNPYHVEEGKAQVNFINNNDGQKSAPLLVWIVRGDAPYQDTEVYDAYGTIRDAAPAGVITVLDAEPFSLLVQSFGDPFPFYAIAAGFDALNNNDKCQRVVSSDAASYQDLHADMRSPLITLVFNTDTDIMLSVTKNTHMDLELTRTSFVTSPGYIGCSVKDGNDHTKTFRSSLYPATSEYEIKSDDTAYVTLNGDLHVDNDHAVQITVDDEQPFGWTDEFSSSIDLEFVKDLKITWAYDETNLDQYFMIRVIPHLDQDRTTTEEPKSTTTEAQPEPKTTTLEPEEQDNTTTEEAGPDPGKTTTTAPEEPEKTTSAEPEEPNKTTTSEDEPLPGKSTTTAEPEEPIRTTTSEPGPEQEKTTTTEVEPEHEKTTTLEPEEPIKTTTSEPGPDHEKTTSKGQSTVHTKPTGVTRRTLPSTSPLPTTSYHPRSSTAPSTTTSTKPSTTSGAGYGSLVLSVAVASLMIFY